MGELLITKAMSLKAKIKKQLNRFKNSRFLLGTLCLIIGITYTYCYLELSKTRTVKILIAHAQVVDTSVESKDETGVVPTIEKEMGTSHEEQAFQETTPLISLIMETFPEEPDTMVQIAKWESSLRPEAINNNKNGSQDCGLMQVNSIHGYDCKWLLDVRNNLQVARKIYDTQGKQAWVSYNVAVKNGLIN